MKAFLLTSHFLLFTLTASAQPTFPKPTGFINDFANVLDAGSRAEFEQLVRDTQQKTSAEISFVSVKSLNGMPVEEYANKLFKEWGIGNAKEDNGLLLLIAMDSHDIKIEVGYGLEGVIPDGLAGQIIREDITPPFKNGDFAGGVRAGLKHISDLVVAHHVLTPEERKALVQSSSNGDPPLWLILPFFGIFVVIGTFTFGAGLRVKLGFPLLFGSMFSLIPGLMSMLWAPRATMYILGPLGLFMLIWGYRTGATSMWASIKSASGKKGESGWTFGGGSGGSSSGGSSSSSSSSGGGGFSGGSSGGGGASGKW
jgi:uncharacterized protein